MRAEAGLSLKDLFCKLPNARPTQYLGIDTLGMQML